VENGNQIKYSCYSCCYSPSTSSGDQ